MFRKFISCLLASTLLIFNLTQVASASETSEEPEMIKGYATAYYLTGITRSGEYTREGICASTYDRLNKTIILYQRLPDDSVGDVIGIYECKDTGGKAIQKGKTIDVWRPTLDECQEFMNLVYEDGCKGHVWIQILDSEG